MFLRIQLCGAKQTPDLFSVMKVMGKERVRERILDVQYAMRTITTILYQDIPSGIKTIEFTNRLVK